ncbi:Uncharacterized [Moorella glycerini]|uniref:Uncharacterized protein n=1 Tax=Neomoorella stamsii TaxID=1266720 RepID=A0A9X7J3L4_9FIRM|nr:MULTISPECIES: hypothetical protein [Moorella]PRR72269.1 hypothetical protein MOST_19800 [Moorella stamsii]CEP68920.1 Uncharacterized [Moorella glycerini]CEP69570.1 Uncharacterized [Moorella glycerini]
MAYLFLVTGAILIVITCLPAFKILLAGEGNPGEPTALGFAPRGGQGQTGGDEQLAERLAILQEEVTALTARLEELTAASGAVPGTFRSYLATALAGGTAGAVAARETGEAIGPQRTSAGPAGEKAVPERTTAAGPAGGTTPGPETLSIQEKIRLAHAAGESIDSLARRFGRGKGEIALILNLKR